MRQKFKNKKRACRICKPWKRGLEVRWKLRERIRLVHAETEARAAVGRVEC